MAGRQPGAEGVRTKELRTMVLAALDKAGGEAWLAAQAEKNPVAFMALIGKIIPKNVEIEPGQSLAELIVAAGGARTIV